LHSGVRIARAALLCLLAVAAGIVLVSGGSGADPRTPPALPGLPPPFLGTTVTGDGGLTAALDSYGDVVDLRPGPAGAALIDNPSDRQTAGTVPEDTGIVPRLAGKPMWEAESVSQRYLPGTNVVRTVARFPGARVVMTAAATGASLAIRIHAEATDADPDPSPSLEINTASSLRCTREGRAGQLDLTCELGRPVRPGVAATAGATANPSGVAGESARLIHAATGEARGWLNRSRPLGSAAPSWARTLYRRSLLTIHALTSRRTGAVAAGARDGWAYVWPRDAATAALALEASGHRAEARRVARFLTGLDLAAAARFTESGDPVPGRAAQGDALGWTDVAARATGVTAPHAPYNWRDKADYQESGTGDYLGNALASARRDADRGIEREFGTARGLVRVAGNPGSGLDSAAAWAVRPFRLSPLYPAAERTLLRLAPAGTPFGITPGEDWRGGPDPWTAPTAWSAWALAGLSTAETRHAALALLTDLRRAATPAGDLPERVGAHTGIPTSTTPLLWSSAFTVLALRELWPNP
jgi:hypothetical protein